jgi:hypothetical protein
MWQAIPSSKDLVLRGSLAKSFQSVKTLEVTSAEVNLDHWSKRTRGAKYESLKTLLFRGFTLRGITKL